VRRPLNTALWILFALFIVYGTTIPFNFSSTPGWAAQKLAHVPLNPFVAADTGRRISIPDFVQNVLLFLPFGVLGALRLRSPSRSRLTTLVVVCGLGAALSLGIEALQLLTVDRTSSTSDIMANTLGALLGVIGAQLGENAWGLAWKTLSLTGVLEQPSSYAALVAAIVLCAAAWQPFDATLEVGSIAPRLRALMSDPWQAGPLTDEGIAAVQYALFAWVTSNLFVEMRLRRSVLAVATIGVLAAFGLEASQIIIGSRMPSVEDASVRAAAVIAGLALWRATRGWHRPGIWFAALVVGVAVGAAMQMLTPFEVSPAYHSFGWFPFFGYYEHTTFEAVSHVFEILLLYFPLGFCACQVIRSRAHATVVSVALTLAIAGPVEYAQGWFVGRYPDVTDVALSVVAVIFGVLAGSYGASLIAARVPAGRVASTP
jgi:glycopeptide antibiotics resistance protein